MEEQQINQGVSIVIPVYNGQDVIERSVRSALDQTHTNIEVVVVDDGSSDSTAAVVQELAAGNSRVVLVQHEANRGRLEARRTGIAHASKEFILFLDADDELLSSAAQQALDAQAGKFDVVQFNFDFAYQCAVTEEEKKADTAFCTPPNKEAYNDDVSHVVFANRETTWSLCGKLFRTSLLKQAIEQISVQSMQTAEDACIYFIYAHLAQSYKGLPSCKGYVYHIDAGGSGTRKRNCTAEQFAETNNFAPAMCCIKNYMEASGAQDSLVQDYSRVYKEHVLAGASRLLQSVEPSQQGQAYTKFLSLWPEEDAIAALAECYWDASASFLAHVGNSSALRYSPRAVKTIGVYHGSMGIGGAERVIAQLVQLWLSLGMRVVLFSDQQRSECRQDIPAEVEWVALPASFETQSSTYEERARLLMQAIRNYRIDLFVYHQWWNPLLTWDMLCVKSSKVPFLLYCHASFRTFFSEAHPNEFDVPAIMRYADGVVCLSAYDAAFWQHFVPRVWETLNPLTLLPNAQQRASLQGRNIVWVGRLSSFDKQPEEALRILAAVAQEVPNAHLTLVGPVENQAQLRNLKQLAARLGIENNVEFAGAQQNVVPYYLDADLLLLTSRFESFCLVLAEAKSCGLPTVMYELPYLTLTQGNKGIVQVPQRDSVGAANEIANLFKSTDRLQQLGADAFAHMEELVQFNMAAFWQNVFSSFTSEGETRLTDELFDAQWDSLIEACKESLEKASKDTLPLALARRGKDALQGIIQRIRK